MPPELLAQLAGRNEVEQHRLLSETAWRWAREHPAQAGALYIRKLGFFWWRSPHTGLLYPSAWTRLYLAYYLGIMALALLGLAAGLTRGSADVKTAAMLLIGFALADSMTQAAFYVEGRHRWQLEPLFLMFTAAGAAQMLTMGKR